MKTKFCESHNENEIDGDGINDTWVCECGFAFTFSEGNPEKNGFKFCPACGRRMKTRKGAADE